MNTPASLHADSAPAAATQSVASASQTALASFDARPFFARALRFGVEHKLLDADDLARIEAGMAKGIVQIAAYFGTPHLRPELELALSRMVVLMSLYLEDVSGGELAKAAASLRDKKLLVHSKGGSEMLKRLYALPDNGVTPPLSVTEEGQRAWLDDKTAQRPMRYADYRAELAVREAHQHSFEFAHWLARRMGVARDEVDDAEALIRSAMLVIHVEKSGWRLPSRTAFVSLVQRARRARAVFNTAHVDAFFADATPAMRAQGHAAMQGFLARDLPRIRSAETNADKLLYGDSAEAFFVAESLDEDVSAYDRLVAREWHRVTRGEADDPQVLATLFLRIATGLDAASTLLLREAKTLIASYRERGFDAPAVLAFVDAHAPEAQRRELAGFWTNELIPEATERLADTDPNWPDSHMERALAYLREVCKASWKGRR